MSRPEPFRHSFVVFRNIPYSIRSMTARDAQHAGGVLGKGQLVWTEDDTGIRPDVVTAFVENLGFVSLDPRWLVPADVLQQKT